MFKYLALCLTSFAIHLFVTEYPIRYKTGGWLCSISAPWSLFPSTDRHYMTCLWGSLSFRGSGKDVSLLWVKQDT